jgi:type I restriction enzyme S subunit
LTSAWQQCELGDVLTLKRGYDLPHQERHPGGIPVVSSSGITGFHNEAKVKAPGVVTGRYGTLGEIFYIEQDFWPLNTTLYVKDFKGNNPRFISYFLKTLAFASQNAAAAVPGVNRNVLHRLPVKVPPLPTQRKIAAVLSAYDDLIENNTRRIAILEDMAQAIYREWFVHFRFPGHEGVRMVESELGPVPEGWEVRHLSELVETQYGYTESAREDPVGPKYVRGTDINKTSYIRWDTVPYCSIDEADYGKYVLRIGDVLVIRMADPGKVGIIEKDIDAVFASYLIRLKIKSNLLSPYFLFYFLSSERYQSYVTGASTGTTRRSASAGVITDIDILLPTARLREQFDTHIVSTREMLNNLLDRNATLRHTRDLLLPRLVSGELDVSELEIEIGGDLTPRPPSLPGKGER